MYKYVFFKLKLFYLEWNAFTYWKLSRSMLFVENKNIKWSDFFLRKGTSGLGIFQVICTFDVSVFIFTAQAAGDPHLTTLDRKDYTFNGIGDFVLLKDVNSSMVVQVRAVQTRDTAGESCKIYKNQGKVLSVSGIKTFIDQIILACLSVQLLF